MAKKKTDNNFISDIQTATGGQLLSEVGTVPYFVDTGSLSLNFMCSGKFFGGGIPGGRITEVYGPPATSKSLLGYCCLASCQRMGGIAVLLDCERASNADFATAAGHVDVKKLLIYEPPSIEKVESKIITVVKTIRKHYGKDTPILLVWDSIGVAPSEREWNQLDLPEDPSAADIKRMGGNEKPGERAKASGNLLRRVNPFLNENNATLFVINQTRSKIGVMFGSPETTAGGGEALKFYASCRLRTSVGKTISAKSGLPLGVNLKFANKKSRSFVPGISTEGVQLFFESGINPVGGLLSILLVAGRIEVSGKKYKVLEPWADGADVSFSANKVENMIPVEVALKAPKLLDFESAEQAEEYFAMFQKAINVATGGEIIERVANNTDDEPDFITELAAKDD